jgi:N-acetylmuramoyl-L-alanine amidase
MRKRVLKTMAGKTMLAVLAAVSCMIVITGCQSRHYEKVVMESTQDSEEKNDQAEVQNSASSNMEVTGKEVPTVTTGAITAGQSDTAKTDVISWEDRDETVYVTADQVNIRQSPSTGGDIQAVAHIGDEFRRTGYSDKWSRVKYDNVVCYVSTQYLTTTKPEIPETTDAASTVGASSSSDNSASGTVAASGAVSLNPDWKYAGNSKINSGTATLYRSTASNRKGKVVCVNAGHGTSGGESVKTLCHPDGTTKVTGGTTSAGATSAVAVSSGMTFADGTPEKKVTLALALSLKEKLLARGYDVLMIRENDDVQLDNVARTVIANNAADCHLALHWDSTTSDKGAFYMSVPNVASYRSMEPVASHWQQHHALGDSLISGLKGAGVKIFSGGSMDMDLTQTSYSTIPSVDIELGDKVSDHSQGTIDKIANGLADGIDQFFGN